MGEMENGQLRCFYHGWAFGTGGACTDIPTVALTGDKRPSFEKAITCTAFAVVEHGGLLWVWRGNVLAADPAKLPAPLHQDEASLVVDTILDYAIDWSHVVEKTLGAPHLPSLLEGAPPNVAALLSAAPPRQPMPGHTATFDEASPHVFHFEGAGDAVEAIHVVPIAPRRTRVLLRQSFRTGPLLSALLAVPGARALCTALVRKWNYQIGLEDMKAPLPADADGVAQPTEAALAHEAVMRFWEWHRRAHSGDAQLYFRRWAGSDLSVPLGRQQTDEGIKGTRGLKVNYVQDHPVPEFAPMVS